MTENVQEQAEVAETKETKTRAPSNRRKFRNDEWTDEQVLARKAELTVETIPVLPDGRQWVKMPDVGNVYRANGIPVTRLVRATGGDRGMAAPVDPLFTVVFVGNTRYLHPDVITIGVERMKNEPSLAATPRKPRKPKEDGDRETGPTRGTKKEKASNIGVKAPKKISKGDQATLEYQG